jgi:succinate dehydrogenase / fumarate reductase flavoprotein subunit
MPTHTYDAIIIGAGGAGLRAAVEMAGLKVAVLTKLYPTRSHTGAAQGGIAAPLGNMEEDNWEWYMFDTVKGGDYLVDQDAAESMCRESIEVVYELEHWGLPFDRTPDGKISQRRFGGHTHNFGKGPVMRAAHSADRTGHMILQTLYQQCVKRDVTFFNEFQVLDVLVDDEGCHGVVAYHIDSGELHTFYAKAVLIAVGGFGRIYKITSNAHALTGEVLASAWRRGLPLMDMEFFQFHPTGIYKIGILLSEGARGEGAVFVNGKGERFMERYSPTLKDLAPRDICSRCVYQEVREGRGIDGKDYVHLDFRHISQEVLDKKLPDITEFVRVYQGLDAKKDLVPIQPTAHYAMGGIPTNVEAQVIRDGRNTPVPGLYAAGECACVSVHGANRLGTNSLMDILTFGRRAGRHMARFIRDADLTPVAVGHNPDSRIRERIDALKARTQGESTAKIRDELQTMMMDKVGVFRTEQTLREALAGLAQLRDRYAKAKIDDRGGRYNTDLLEALELGGLLDLADATAASCLHRTESRGGHFREDYPTRDDVNWLKHALIYRRDDGTHTFDHRPIVITRFQPMERKY